MTRPWKVSTRPRRNPQPGHGLASAKSPWLATLVLGLGLGIIIAQVLWGSRSSSETNPGAGTLVLHQTTFTDERTLGLDLTADPPAVIVASAPGVVTHSTCAAGATITSGTRPFEIDGKPLLALASARPLWRDLGPGTTGPDVTAVVDELVSLKHLEPMTTAVITPQVIAAVARLSGSPMTSISRSSIIWLPARSVVVHSCDLVVGQHAGAGAPLASVLGALRAAQVKLPETPRGDRQVRVDEVQVPLTASGEVAPGDLAKLAAAPGIRRWLSSDKREPLLAQVSLVRPVQAWLAPPQVIVSNAWGQRCVIDGDGRPHPVSVVSSQLGRTVIEPKPPARGLPEVVRLDDGTLTCG